MSCKTLRGASKWAFKKNAGAGALGRAAYLTIGFVGLALGVFMLGTGAELYARNVVPQGTSGQPALPGKAATAQRRRLEATPIGSQSLITPNGAGLYAQNATIRRTSVGAASTNGQSSATALAPIIVTGIRGSLMRSLAIKRESIGVVDAISAETIGQFPDSSVGGALAHLPGVTVNRGSLAYSSAEGSPVADGLPQGVNVNGFGGSFDTVLENGRQIASGNGQTFNFSGIGAMYVGQIDVLKTPDMALSSGNVGSVINVKMLTPFDNPGLHVGLNVGASDYTMDGGNRPAVGALFSDTFDHDKFGILVDGDYTDYHTLAHQMDVAGWKGVAAGGFPCSDLAGNFTTAFGNTGCAGVGAGATGAAQVPVWYPQQMLMTMARVDTRTKDGRAVLQWHPIRSVMVTLDENYSSWDYHNKQFERASWFGGFPDSTLDHNGTITDFNYTGPIDFNSEVEDEYIVTNTYGLNVLWNINSDWTVDLDADQSESKFNPNGTYSHVDVDTGFGDAKNNYTGGLVLSQNGNNLPYWSAYGPNAVASGTGAVASPNYNGLHPFIIGSHVVPLQTQQNSDQINEATLRATWNPGNSTKVTFGTQFIDDDWNTKEMDTFTNNYWELWAGYGPASGNGPGAGVALLPSMFSPVSVGTFMPGYGNNGNLPATLLLYNPYTVLNYLIHQPVDPSQNAVAVADGYPAYTGGYLPPEALSPTSVQHVARMNYAPFVQVSHDFRIHGMKLMTRLGMRYQRTDETIGGLSSLVTNVAWLGASDPTAYSFALSKPTWVQTTRSYGYFLPAVDLALWPSEDLETAFDFSRTESAPPNGSLIPNTSYSGRVNALSASGNNPGLLPYLSNNYDLRVTWFYKHGDYAELHPFYKQVSNFPTSTVTDVTLPINDPAPCTYTAGGAVVFTDSNCGKPMVFAESTISNKLSADVTGVSATWQQMLPYGFGVLINGTWMHSNANFNDYSLTSNQFALSGVGSSANGTLFYQRGKWQARLTVNWQAKLLLLVGQEQGGGAFGNEPVYQAPFTQLDFATNYQVDRYLNVYFDANNLLNSIYHTYGRFPNQTLDVIDYGTSLEFGVRAKF
jgi:TonB-dependent receptor